MGTIVMGLSAEVNLRNHAPNSPLSQLLSSISVRPAGSCAHVPGGGGGGSAVTVIDEEPLVPSLAAVIGANPATKPLTNPLPFTLARSGAPLDHEIARPVRVVPLATFESPPNTASTFSVPRNAVSWNW